MSGLSECQKFWWEQIVWVKLIDTITTSNIYLKFKENNENDMAPQVFLSVFYSSRRPSQSGPIADFEGAAIPPPIFSMGGEQSPTSLYAPTVLLVVIDYTADQDACYASKVW